MSSNSIDSMSINSSLSNVSLNTSGAFIFLSNTILFLNSNVNLLSTKFISLQYFSK